MSAAGFESIGEILERVIPEIRGGIENDAGEQIGEITDEEHEHSLFLDKLAAIEDVGQVEAAEEEARLHARESLSETMRKDQRRRDAALWIWDQSKPAPGTLAETYFRARGCNLPESPYIRFCEALRYPGTDLMLPAVICGITFWPQRIVESILRIYLTPSGDAKAEVENAKLMLGPVMGGAVRLAAPGARMAVCEGIETGASLLTATDLPVWAALSTAGLKALEIPPPEQVPEVVICADRDENRAGENAAEDAAKRWHERGHVVRIVLPSPGFNDFNDMLTGTQIRGDE